MSFLWQYWQSFMTVIHRKLLLKVSSDAAAVPKAINVFAIWCWVWVSHFLLLDLITLLYVDFCFLYLFFITSSKKLPQWNQFWNILWKRDVVNRSYAVWRCIVYYSHIQSCFCEFNFLYFNFLICPRIACCTFM